MHSDLRYEDSLGHAAVNPLLGKPQAVIVSTVILKRSKS